MAGRGLSDPALCVARGRVQYVGVGGVRMGRRGASGGAGLFFAFGCRPHHPPLAKLTTGGWAGARRATAPLATAGRLPLRGLVGFFFRGPCPVVHGRQRGRRFFFEPDRPPVSLAAMCGLPRLPVTPLLHVESPYDSVCRECSCPRGGVPDMRECKGVGGMGRRPSSRGSMSSACTWNQKKKKWEETRNSRESRDP